MPQNESYAQPTAPVEGEGAKSGELADKARQVFVIDKSFEGRHRFLLNTIPQYGLMPRSRQLGFQKELEREFGLRARAAAYDPNLSEAGGRLPRVEGQGLPRPTTQEMGRTGTGIGVAGSLPLAMTVLNPAAGPLTMALMGAAGEGLRQLVDIFGFGGVPMTPAEATGSMALASGLEAGSTALINKFGNRLGNRVVDALNNRVPEMKPSMRPVLAHLEQIDPTGTLRPTVGQMSDSYPFQIFENWTTGSFLGSRVQKQQRATIAGLAERVQDIARVKWSSGATSVDAARAVVEQSQLVESGLNEALAGMRRPVVEEARRLVRVRTTQGRTPRGQFTAGTPVEDYSPVEIWVGTLGDTGELRFKQDAAEFGRNVVKTGGEEAEPITRTVTERVSAKDKYNPYKTESKTTEVVIGERGEPEVETVDFDTALLIHSMWADDVARMGREMRFDTRGKEALVVRKRELANLESELKQSLVKAGRRDIATKLDDFWKAEKVVRTTWRTSNLEAALAKGMEDPAGFMQTFKAEGKAGENLGQLMDGLRTRIVDGQVTQLSDDAVRELPAMQVFRNYWFQSEIDKIASREISLANFGKVVKKLFGAGESEVGGVGEDAFKMLFGERQTGEISALLNDIAELQAPPETTLGQMAAQLTQFGALMRGGAALGAVLAGEEGFGPADMLAVLIVASPRPFARLLTSEAGRRLIKEGIKPVTTVPRRALLLQRLLGINASMEQAARSFYEQYNPPPSPIEQISAGVSGGLGGQF